MAWDLISAGTRRFPDFFSRALLNLRLIKWLVLTVITSFIGGFGAALLLRPSAKPVLSVPNLSDYEIDLPQGQIDVSITDPRIEPAELVKLTIKRHGDAISGVPQTVKHLPQRLHLSAEDLTYFRRQLRGVFFASDSTWERANKIREWLARFENQTGEGNLSRNPRKEYEEMIKGEPVLCGNLADIYVALCEAAGLTARGVGLSILVRDGRPRADSHAAAEVWIPELGGWVYEDPTFNCYWEVSGQPASAVQIHEAVMRGEEPQFQPHDPKTAAQLRNYYVDPRLLFRHLSYEYRIGGPLLYLADEHLEPFSMEDPNWVQSDDPNDFKGPDGNGLTVLDKHGEVAPGIFVQLIGQKLFVRDRRARDRGIRVRLSQGAVRGCAYEHLRAEAMRIFDSNNFVRNGLFRVTPESENVAVGWNVSGEVYGLTVFGGQGMGTDLTGRLWQPLRVPPSRSYLLYARLSVTRGTVTWSLSDAESGKKSSGSVEPGRMGEILSDVVPSSSGSLTVAFDLPAGGAFRVMDVIVAEAPRLPAVSDDVPTDAAATEQ